MSQRDFLLQFFRDELRCLYSTPWNKLYLKSIIRQNAILFDESLNFGEDTYFNFQYYACISNVYLSDQMVYHVHHPPGEPGHLSGTDNMNIGKRIKYAIIMGKVYRNAASQIIPNRNGICEVFLMDSLWGSMSSNIRHDYPAFRKAICSYDWGKLLAECPVDSFGWGYKFLYKSLTKKKVRLLFCFSCIKRWLSSMLSNNIKNLLRPHVMRRKQNFEYFLDGPSLEG